MPYDDGAFHEASFHFVPSRSRQDTTAVQQESLRTRGEGEAHTLLHAKNEAFRQPVLNLQIVHTYLTATDSEIARRTWRAVMDEIRRDAASVLHRDERHGLRFCPRSTDP